MSGVERLDSFMLRKETTNACEKTRVKSILKTGTNTDGILLLAQEWSRSTHELLIISLNRAGDFIAIAICVHLADVIQSRMGWLL
jgi:hypothetical protein